MKILEVGFRDGPSLEEGFSAWKGKGTFKRVEFESPRVFLDSTFALEESYDLVAFFPACSVFSMMSVRHHWRKEIDSWGDSVLLPKSQKASEALEMLGLMDQLMSGTRHWFIENPAGTMHKQWTRGNFHRITHCQYGGTRMKPTNIWTSWDWVSKPSCKYGDPCHPATPRGSRKTGTQTMRTKAERARLPIQLSVDLIESVFRKILSTEKRISDALDAGYPERFR